MKKQICSFLSVSTLTLMLGVGTSFAQQQDPPTPSQTPSTQQPSSQPDATPQPSDSAKNTQTPTGTAQTFTGTVVKSGDKFMLQDANGTSYDVDKQDVLKSLEGKKVNIRGTLDASGKLIHVQQ